MMKNKGPSYTAQMKSKVNYPKMKSAVSSKEPKVGQLPSSESPSMIRKETVVLSMATPVPDPEPVENIQEEREWSPEKLNEKKSSSLSRKDTIVIQRNKGEEPPNVENVEKKMRKPPITPASESSSPSRDNSTESKSSSIPSRDDIIQLVRTEPIFESLDHRRAILELVSDYAKNVWRGQILETLNHPVFEDIDNLEEVSMVLNDFVATKLNNNN